MPITKTIKFTNSVIDKALKNRAETTVYRDTEVKGLMLRVGPRNATYSLDYKQPGTRPDGRRWPSQTFKIGTPASHDVAAARKAAAALKVSVNEGHDPASDRKTQRAKRALEVAQAKTMNDLVEDYIVANLSEPTNHCVTQKGALRNAVKEMNVEKVGPEAVTAGTIMDMLRVHRGRPRALHRFGALSRFFDDLVSREVVSANPCQKVPKPKRPKPPAPRTRYYTATEVQALYEASGLATNELLFLRCALYLPLRQGELANLKGEHVDKAGARLLLPGKITKNGDPFALPVPSVVFELLEIAEVDLVDGLSVFGLSSTEKPFSGHSALATRVRAASGITDFNMHHLRRTFLTTLAESGAADAAVADALLNHRQSATRSGVLAAYNHASLWPQKVRAMDTWARLVAHAVDNGEWGTETQVVNFRRPA